MERVYEVTMQIKVRDTDKWFAMSPEFYIGMYATRQKAIKAIQRKCRNGENITLIDAGYNWESYSVYKTYNGVGMYEVYTIRERKVES